MSATRCATRRTSAGFHFDLESGSMAIGYHQSNENIGPELIKSRTGRRARRDETCPRRVRVPLYPLCFTCAGRRPASEESLRVLCVLRGGSFDHVVRLKQDTTSHH